MTDTSPKSIPLLTEIFTERLLAAGLEGMAPRDAVSRAASDGVDTLIAELQTRIATESFKMTEQIVRDAFAEFEARLLGEVSLQLRDRLPELIDAVLRSHFDQALKSG